MKLDHARTDGKGTAAGGESAMLADLRLRLQGSQEQERAARAEARRLARELGLARRLLRFCMGSPAPARPGPAGALVSPLGAKTAKEVPRLRATLLTEKAIFHLDAYQKRGAHTIIAGWAFRPAPGWDGRTTVVTLLFRHDTTVYAVAAGQVRRPDVAAHFAAQPTDVSGEASGLDGAGFQCEILNDSLPAGVDLEIVLRLECAGLACEQSTGERLRL